MFSFKYEQNLPLSVDNSKLIASLFHLKISTSFAIFQGECHSQISKPGILLYCGSVMEHVLEILTFKSCKAGTNSYIDKFLILQKLVSKWLMSTNTMYYYCVSSFGNFRVVATPQAFLLRFKQIGLYDVMIIIIIGFF